MTIDGRTGLRAFAFTLAGWLACSSPAHASDPLVLYRRASDGLISFFVRGADPGELVLLATTDGTPLQGFEPVTADAAGGCCWQISAAELPLSTQPIGVQAFVVRQSRETITSNPVLLRQSPLVWMVVERGDSMRSELRFDAADATIEEVRRGRGRGDDVLAARGAAAFVAEGESLIALASAEVHEFAGREEVIDLAVTPDESALVALTRELVGDGRTLLRTRLLDAAHVGRELASFEVAGSATRLASAWLVAAEDSHRVLIAEPTGLVHELVLGESISRGVTLLPLRAAGGEELVDCAVRGDWMAVVTRATGSRSAGRLLLVDLAHRGSVREMPLLARPLDLAIVEPVDGLVALVAIEGGVLERVECATGLRSALTLPGVVRLAPNAAARRCYAIAGDVRGDGVALFLLDQDLRGAEPLPDLGPLARASDIGTVEADGREWIWLVERRFLAPRPGAAEVDDWLWWAEIDPVDGRLAGALGRLAVGGRIRNIVSR